MAERLGLRRDPCLSGGVSDEIHVQPIICSFDDDRANIKNHHVDRLRRFSVRYRIAVPTETP